MFGTVVSGPVVLSYEWRPGAQRTPTKLGHHTAVR